MPSAITPRALATSSTTTVVKLTGNVTSQPFEGDTIIVDGTIDLDATTALERSVSLALAWENLGEGPYRLPQLDVRIDASENTTGPWKEVAKFDLVNLDTQVSGSQSIGFVSPGRYLRARSTITARDDRSKRSARFSVIGSKS